MDGFTNVFNPQTGGYWLAPDALVDELVAGGWEVCDSPAEHNPAVAEQAAWREEAAQRAADEAAAEKAATKTTKPARRGETQED